MFGTLVCAHSTRAHSTRYAGHGIERALASDILRGLVMTDSPAIPARLITIRRPTAVPRAGAGVSAHTLGRTLISGRKVGIRYETAWRSWMFIADRWAEYLRRDGAEPVMLQVGERTGELSTQLENSATFYEEELDYAVEKMTGLFEPITILFIGLVVGFVAVAMVSAMYGLYSQVEI